MVRAPKLATLLGLLASTCGLAACGDDDVAPADAGTDATADTGPPAHIEDLPVRQTLTLPGLSAPVDVVRDERGYVHIYASTIEDAFRAEGYAMASDRIGQMDFVRRFAMGRLAELAGSLSPSLVASDEHARFVGHRRNAEAIYASLPAESRTLLDAFAAGVTARVREIRDGTAVLPPAIANTLGPDFIDDWTPQDTLAIARYQSAALGYDGDGDASMTAALVAWDDAFPASSTDPHRAALAGAFHDLFAFAPSEAVFVRDGFPNLATDSGTRALRRPRARPVATPYVGPSRPVAEGAARYLDAIEADFRRTFGDQFRGSNNWVVHGSKTASGRPILANDPHLQLYSPALFWPVHIDTKRRGGDVNAQGLALAGTPVILLGYNDDIAWGLTTTGYDTTDCYRETITPGTGGAPDTVLFEGRQVPIVRETESIRLDTGTTREVVFERVPHHGLIIPTSRTPTEAISIRWTGDTPSNEAGAFLGLMRARNVDEARAAFHEFEVGHQNLVVASRDGHITWSTHLDLPVRDARAMTYDPATRMGYAPAFVLPGTGEYEWTGRLDDRYIPHDLDPAAGYIATANGDAVGVTADGNPFDAPHYIGWDFDRGHRIARIKSRLDVLAARGGITVDEMIALQGDARSPLGAIVAPGLVASLDRAEAERATPGTHPELGPTILELGAPKLARIRAMRDRLAAWTSFETPAAVEGTPSAAELADSVATTIFNVAIGRLVPRMLDDETTLVGRRGTWDRTLVAAFRDPSRMASYDATAGDTVLWDDLDTTAVETRDEIVLRAFSDALDFLETRLGADAAGWRWGRLHTLTLSTIVPQLGTDLLSIPPEGDPTFPSGFPRHGDLFVVDASNHDLFDGEDFSYGSGPVQRLVVELGTDGPHAYNALPGGAVYDPDSPHHRDEMEHWRRNEAPAVYFTETDVLAHFEERIRFAP